MPETVVDAKQTAANIAKGIQDKATGKPAEAATKPDAAAADPNAGKRRYVVEGKEVFLTPEQADAYVQKGIAFEPRISEIARMKQESQQLLRALVDNPGAVLKNLAGRANVPIQSLIEKVLTSNASDEVKEATGKWYWENVAKLHKMDPKDRELYEAQEKLKSMQADEEKRTATTLAEQNRVRVDQAMAQIKAQIADTLKEIGVKDIDTPLGARLTKEVADVMRLGYVSGKAVTAKQAAEIVKKRLFDQQKEFYDVLDEDKLVEMIGKENAEKVRKHFLKLVKDQEKQERKEDDGLKAPVRRDQRKTLNMDDFHDYLDDLKKKSK